MLDVALKCHCGAVRGVARKVSPAAGTRVVCYCDDCQAFARYLGNEDVTLDCHGGTDVFQYLPSRVEISSGSEQLRSLRLTRKGILRWYTACCNTPVANTVSAKVPFVSIIHNFMDDAGNREQNLGPVMYRIHGKFATDGATETPLHPGVPKRLLMRVLPRLLIAKLRGQSRPNPFFDDSGAPISKPLICSDALD